MMILNGTWPGYNESSPTSDSCLFGATFLAFFYTACHIDDQNRFTDISNDDARFQKFAILSQEWKMNGKKLKLLINRKKIALN